VRTYQSIRDTIHQSSVARMSSSMAAVIESVRWRTSQKGNRYLAAVFTDATGQFQANCFDEATAKTLQSYCETGVCVLLGVEIEKPDADEEPRIGIQSATSVVQALSAGVKSVTLNITNADQLLGIKTVLSHDSMPGNCKIYLRLDANESNDHVVLALAQSIMWSDSLAVALSNIVPIDAGDMISI
jgi:DNA polymerase III subunit alpha